MIYRAMDTVVLNKPSGKETADPSGIDFLDYEIKSFVGTDSSNYGEGILHVWTVVDLDGIGIRTVNVLDDYDKLKYDVTGTPTETVQGDGTYNRSHPAGILTEKGDYLGLLKVSRKNECIVEYDTEHAKSYTSGGYTLQVCDCESYQSLYEKMK